MNKIQSLWAVVLILASCGQKAQKEAAPTLTGAKGEVRLITLDPGHFHAALVQKTSYPQISPDVYVYSPGGSDLEAHLAKIEAYNTRAENPTHWNENVYRGEGFLEKMLSDKKSRLTGDSLMPKADVMVTAGNNRLKTDYIKKALEAGINVLADKPMVITPEKFDELRECFDIARDKGVLLYDIMTERHEITSILQRELAHIPGIYGEQLPGTPQEPGVEMTSVHNFYKVVSGNPLTRPAWFYDISQQGEGLVDVSTHLVDLAQWELFPNEAINYETDISMTSARRWPTPMTLRQFQASTGLDAYPDFLLKDVQNDTLLVYQNGEIRYQLRGVNIGLTILWNYETPQGGDSHYSQMRGSKATLTIRQGEQENYRPELYITPSKEVLANAEAYAAVLRREIPKLAKKYPGIELEVAADKRSWHVIIPDTFRNGHEAHFGQVTENYLRYLKEGQLPQWEVPCMLAKYYVTTQALRIALGE